MRRLLRDYWGLAIAAALVVNKCQELIRHAIVASEDSRTYIATALEYPWPLALIEPHTGYFSLTNNIIAILAANLVELRNWGYFLTGCSLLIAFLCMLVPYISA
ncbi:MAG: hypothetical protein EBX37_04350 [Alphaproteobacteria bacterium]|nr:hypothetical protein [Alphaproteobacteria bacterium]